MVKRPDDKLSSTATSATSAPTSLSSVISLASGNPLTSVPSLTRLPQQSIEGVLVPNSYEVWPSGVSKRKVYSVEGDPPLPSLYAECPTQHAIENLELITSRPCYVSGLGFRLDDTRELVALTFLSSYSDAVSGGGDIWRTLWVSHGQIADTRELLKLAVEMFPVTSANAKDLVIFLTRMVDENFRTLVRQKIARRSGYHQIDEGHGWLVGKQWIGPGSLTADPVLSSNLVKAIRSSGTLEGWRDFVEPAMEEDWVMRWTLACAFTAPLLRWIPKRTFFVHHYTHTGGAKTTLSYMGQSAWGHPKGFTTSFNMTQKSAIEMFSYVSDLPMLIDELQASTISPSAMLMQVCEETPRPRADASGGLLPSTQPWRTLIRTTGEHTLAGADKVDPGGQAGRVLEIRHPGLPETTGIKVFRWLDSTKNYGVAGPAFLQRLAKVVNDSAKLAALKAKFVELRSALEQALGALRTTIDHLAAIALGEYLMLLWVFDYDMNAHMRAQAWALSLRDAIDMGRNHLRSKDEDGPMWQKCVDFLVEHRHTMPQCYVNLSPENVSKWRAVTKANADGRGDVAPSDRIAHAEVDRLLTRGAGGGTAIVGAYNAGRSGDELWYFPKAMGAVLQRAMDMPPTRLWEDLAEHKIIQRDKNHMGKHRQIDGVTGGSDIWSGRVIVADPQAMVEAGGGKSKVIDLGALLSLAPQEGDLDD